MPVEGHQIQIISAALSSPLFSSPIALIDPFEIQKTLPECFGGENLDNLKRNHHEPPTLMFFNEQNLAQTLFPLIISASHGNYHTA